VWGYFTRWVIQLKISKFLLRNTFAQPACRLVVSVTLHIFETASGKFLLV
jgi:hypothetical protein